MNLTSAQLPVIRSYAKALEVFENQVPYKRGRDKGLKPLGRNRRYNYCQIEKDETDNVISLVMYESKVVQIYPDDTMHISLCGYDTVGTRQFIYATTPYGVKHELGVTYLCVANKWYVFENDKAAILVKNNVVLNPKPQKTYKLNRAAMKDVAKLYAPFREYVKSMGSVLTGITFAEIQTMADSLPSTLTAAGAKILHRIELPSSNVAYGFRMSGANNRATISEFLERVKKAQEPEDLQEYYRLFAWLGVSSLNYNNRLQSWTVHYWDDNPIVEIGPTMLDFFNEMVKHTHREELFTEIEVPIGEKPSNKNRKYFIY